MNRPLEPPRRRRAAPSGAVAQAPNVSVWVPQYAVFRVTQPVNDVPRCPQQNQLRPVSSLPCTTLGRLPFPGCAPHPMSPHRAAVPTAPIDPDHAEMSPSAVGRTCMVGTQNARGKQERLLRDSNAIHSHPGKTGRAGRGDRGNRPTIECLHPKPKSRYVVLPPVF